MEERRHNEYIEKEIMEMQAISKLHVEKTTFTWTVGLFSFVVASLLGILYTMITNMDADHNAKIEVLEKAVVSNNIDYTKIATQLTQIQADLAELKMTLKEHSN